MNLYYMYRVDLYEQRGLPREKAEKVIGIMAKYKKLFIEVMVREELGLIIPDPKESPAMSGFFTFISFFVFGSIPLLCYCVFLNVFRFVFGRFFFFFCVCVRLKLIVR